MYGDDDLLMLSGIQHYAFCPRQWAMIHIEQQWDDNHLTIEGQWLHRKVDDPLDMDFKAGTVCLHAVPVKSLALGFFGIADLLELHPLADSAETPFLIDKYPGKWSVVPVEYKHGRHKDDDIDEVQLCAQAICLEEMYGIHIPTGAFFYGATRTRETLAFSEALRNRVAELSNEMHRLFEAGRTPEAKITARCRACSLRERCFESDMRFSSSVSHYLKQLEE